MGISPFFILEALSKNLFCVQSGLIYVLGE